MEWKLKCESCFHVCHIDMSVWIDMGVVYLTGAAALLVKWTNYHVHSRKELGAVDDRQPGLLFDRAAESLLIPPREPLSLTRVALDPFQNKPCCNHPDQFFFLFFYAITVPSAVLATQQCPAFCNMAHVAFGVCNMGHIAPCARGFTTRAM